MTAKQREAFLIEAHVRCCDENDELRLLLEVLLHAVRTHSRNKPYEERACRALGIEPE